MPLGRRVEQAQDREQRRLAAARGPGDRDVLALADLEVDVGERVRLDLVGVEDLAQPLEPDQSPVSPLIARSIVLLASQSRQLTGSRSRRRPTPTCRRGSPRRPRRGPRAHLDRADRRPPELHLHAHAPRSCPSTSRKRPTVLSAGPCAGRPTCSTFAQPLELDRAVDREVGPRALRQLAHERDVDRDRAVLHRGVDADDARRSRRRCACRSTAFWPITHVAGLRLGDAHDRLQLVGLRDAREVRARRRPAGRPRPAPAAARRRARRAP